jgi:hypothetical protein
LAVHVAIHVQREAVQLGGGAAGRDGGFVSFDLLPKCSSRSQRKLRRARSAPGVDGGINVHKALFAVEQWPQLAPHDGRHDCGVGRTIKVGRMGEVGRRGRSREEGRRRERRRM